MEETIKRFLYTSVGLVAQTSTKIREMIDELIRDRKITEEEGKRIVEDFTNKTKSQTTELEDQLRSFSSKFNKEAASSAEEEIQQLKARIKALENKLDQSRQNNTTTNREEATEAQMEHDPLHQKKELFKQKLEEEETAPVNKVVHDKQVNLGDDVLTPEKKSEAEQQRMHSQSNRPSAERGEKDRQQTNLSGPILTPGKKVENDKKEQE